MQKVKIGYKMKLKSNIVDPYIGQTAEGKKMDFESIDSIKSVSYTHLTLPTTPYV